MQRVINKRERDKAKERERERGVPQRKREFGITNGSCNKAAPN